jgi:hypothetical protein
VGHLPGRELQATGKLSFQFRYLFLKPAGHLRFGVRFDIGCKLTSPHFSPRSLLLSSAGAALSKPSDRAAGCGI